MLDVVIIGGGRSGTATAQACKNAGLSIAMIDLKPLSSEPEHITGKAFVAGPNRVAALDLKTGDETQILQSRVIVVATGAHNNLPNSAFLGLRKLGIELTETGAIRIDESGQTSARTIFAIGSCTASGQPDLPCKIATAITALLQQNPAMSSLG